MLEDVIAITAELQRALEAEVERTRAERAALRTLDARRIFAGATARAAFNAGAARIESRLAGALAGAAERLGLAEVSLAELARRVPEEAAALSRALTAVRGAATALADLDRQDLILTGRALACVQGYLAALQPAPTAYDRRGVRTAAGRSATVWSKV